MADQPPAKIDAHNEDSLAQLCRLLWLSQGEFELILAVCNSTQHRQALVNQLRQQCSVAFQTITLDPTSTTLFTAIRQQLETPWPEALMVFGLENVQDLEPVLTATNQVREEFRQFPFPLVLWLPDDGLKPLMRMAPDFYTWANVITFRTPPEFFLAFLDQLIHDVHRHVLNAWESHFLSNQDMGLVPGSPRCRELEASLSVLAERHVDLAPAQQAALEFVRGRISDNNAVEAREHYERSIAQWQALLADPLNPPRLGDVESAGLGEPKGDSPAWEVSLGHAQFYLGLWWRNHAERDRRQFEESCQKAYTSFRAAVETFEAAQREDLAAKYINYQAESLHRLERWHDLEPTATKALALHKTQQFPFRVARAKGFLADVALSKQDYATAQHHAEAALAIIQADNGMAGADSAALYRWVNSFHRSAYLLSLGNALLAQSQLDEAVMHLEQARESTQPEYAPHLYSQVLEQLHLGYFQQGKYLQAFETRRQKDAVESRFNYRAFIGAARLQPRQHIANPALPSQSQQPQDAIATSGRRRDVERLVMRLAQDELVLTIVYGPSGVGKSSLIEAGLIPRLERERFETRRVVPMYVRRYQDWEGELVGVTSEGLDPPSGPPLERGEVAVLPSGEGVSRDVRPLLKALRDRTQDNQVLVLIFDQFEEFFFEFDQPTARRPFYEFLRDCLTTPYIKVVLSLREDYIHHLLECDRLTDLAIIDNNILDKKWLYYLGNFTPDETKAVMLDLAEPTPYNPEAALVERVVDDLAAGSGEVRPIELQVVGAQLQAEDITTPEGYHNWGDPALPTKELLVQKYLTDIVRECGPEGNQQLAEMVLYLLTDERGTRPLKTASDLVGELRTYSDAAEPNREALGLVLQILRQSGLVMEVPDAPEDRYQLVHDYLAAFIRSQQQPLMVQLERERRMRQVAEQERFAEQRRRLTQARWGLVGLAAVSFVAIGGGVTVWGQRQEAFRGEVNAQFVSESLKMGSLIDSGLEEEAMTQALLTAQGLMGRDAKTHLEPSNRFRAASAIQKVVYGVREQERLIGHSNKVNGVAFSADGNMIATASWDNTVKLWNLNGEELDTLQGHNARVNGVAFSPDGRTVISASWDNTVKLWNLNGEELNTLQGHSDAVYDVAFSPDGNTIATASWDNTVKLWNLDGEELNTLQGHSDGVFSVTFSPDSSTVASASWDNTVKLWNLNGEELNALQGHNAEVFGVAFSPDGSTIASASNDNTVKLWSRDGEELQTLRGHSATVTDVAFSPDGSTIVSAGVDSTVRLWSRNGEELQTFQGHSAEVFDVAFSPDGSTIVSASYDNTAKLWSRDEKELQTLQGHSATATDVAFSPDGSTIASASNDNTVRLWNREGKELQTLKGHEAQVFGIAFSPDGKTIASASSDNTVKLWSRDGKELNTLQGHKAAVADVAFSYDGSIIASVSWDNTVRLWNFDGRELQTLRGHNAPVSGVAFSPDGNIFASVGGDNIVRLWNFDGKELRIFQGHDAQVTDVVFSADGRTIASASNDNSVRLWSRDGKELQALQGHDAPVNGVAFSPDGNIIASISWDDTMKLWNRDGEELNTFQDKDAMGSGLAFSPDGKTITSVNGNTVKLWNFELDDLIARGCDWYDTYFVTKRPELLIDLEICQHHDSRLTAAAAPKLLKQAQIIARSGNTRQAIKIFKQAVTWDSTLDINPRSDARNLAEGQSLMGQGETLARQGRIQEAIAKFEAAKALDPDLDLDPETRAKELATPP